MRVPRIAHVATVDLTLRFLLLGQLRRLRDEGFDVTAISAPGPWVTDIEAERIRHIAWRHATRAWRPAADARAFGELVAILRRERFDLVHTHNPKPGVMGRIAGRLAGVPCVVNTMHGLYTSPEDPAARRLPVLAAEWIAARFSDLELYQSEEDLVWARRIGLLGRVKSVLLGNGTDLSRFDPSTVTPERVGDLRRELGISEDALVVGTVGRLVAEKGFRELVEAARRVRAAVPEARFVAIGSSDDEKSDVISSEEIAGAAGDVLVTGWREDVRDLLAMLDVFVLPSWREGMPRSAIEAAAMGRPLVLTDIRGCREVARDGIEGILVPPRDPKRLAVAILSLLRDPALRVRMGAAARARAVERFDERPVAQTVVEESRALLRMRGLPTAVDGTVRIRRARPADAAALARIHREALPEAFLPTLGGRFLRRLYRAMAADPAAVALVAENGQGVVGFATGVRSVGRFYRRFLVRHGIPAAVAAAPHVLRRGVLRRVRETASYPSGTGLLPDPELLSIAVEPARRSMGIGRILARGIVSGLAEAGAEEVKVVVGADNVGANRFYEGLGFRHAARIAVHGGTPSNVWVIRCTP
ncbi:MAG: GNAT family N-acetyltransferase [Actinomycetota bacterium]